MLSLANLIRFTFACLMILGPAFVYNVYAEPECCACHEEVAEVEIPSDHTSCEEACSEGCTDCTCCGSHVTPALSLNLDAQMLSYQVGEHRLLSFDSSALEGVRTQVFAPPQDHS